MLFLLLSWCFIFFLSVSYGLLGWKLFSRLFFTRTNPELPQPEFLSLLGICLLSWLVSLISFFSPVNLAVQLTLTGIALPISAFFSGPLKQCFGSLKSYSAGKILLAGIFSVYVLLLLVQGSKWPTFYDVGLYHAQFIQWVQQFAVVPGLGNLYGRLAFNSHFHVLSAFFSVPSLNPSPLYQALGTYLYLLFTVFASRRAIFHFKANNRLTLFYLLALSCVYAGFRPWISSPMPDSAVMIFILFILAFFLERLGTAEKPAILGNSYLILVLLATLITFKLSGVYFSLMALFLMWQTPAIYRRKLVMATTLIYLAVLLPWLGRNVILSGYLLYPFPNIDLFNSDWKVPLSQVNAEQDIIVHFARWSAPDYRDHKNATLSEWLPFWWKTQERQYQVLLLATLLALIVQGIFRGKRNINRQFSLYFLLLICLSCCFFWFISAPTLRFGYGYLVAAALCGILLSCQEQVSRTLIYAVAFGSMIYGLNALRNDLAPANLRQTLIQPAAIFEATGMEVEKNGIIFRIEPEDHCWNMPIPCTNKFPDNLELRGNSLQEGFRVTSP